MSDEMREAFDPFSPQREHDNQINQWMCQLKEIRGFPNFGGPENIILRLLKHIRWQREAALASLPRITEEEAVEIMHKAAQSDVRKSTATKLDMQDAFRTLIAAGKKRSPAMTNSQKEFEKWFFLEMATRWYEDFYKRKYFPLNVGECPHVSAFAGGFRACNARWEQKLDEKVLLLVISGLPNNSRADGLVITQAIIKHFKGE